MSQSDFIPAALSIDHLSGDARSAFDLASKSRFHGIAFPTNHAELAPDHLGQSARRHLKTILAAKQLSIDGIRISAPPSSLTDPSTIDRTLDNARKAFLLARDLGVSTVSLNIGTLAQSKTPGDTLIAAIRDLSQHADASGLTLALGADTAAPLAEIIKRVDYDRARINLDSARLIGAGEDPLQLAEDFSTMLGQLTATDAIRAGSSLRPTFLGEGQLPLPELLEILEEQGFRGPMIVDLRDLPDPAAGARHAAHVLHTLFQR